MDTYMRISAYGDKAPEAVAAAEQEITRLDKLLSANAPNSELAQLQQKRSATVSKDMALLLERSFQLHQQTKGAFDITLLPLSRLWGFPHGPYIIPSEQEQQVAHSQTGMDKISWNKETRHCVLNDASLAVDLGGIAKGYAAEQAAAVLRQKGCRNALFNLGGNIKAMGTKPDGSLWKISIQHPDDKEAYLGILTITDTSVVTSGDYERFFIKDGNRYHHILNPATGLPANNGLRSVTIVCPDSTMADGLSTALFVLGPRQAISYWQQHKQEFELILYTTAGKLYVTEGLRQTFNSKIPVEILR